MSNKSESRFEGKSDVAKAKNGDEGKDAEAAREGSGRTTRNVGYRHLLPGFCETIPDLSVWVWADGRAEVTSGHRSEIGFADGSPVLVILSGGLPYFGIPVAKLVVSAFTAVGVERIESVRHVDWDPSNCWSDNLEPVYVEEPRNEEALIAMRRAARDEGLRLAGQAEFFDDDLTCSAESNE